jgi:hypothetical protein
MVILSSRKAILSVIFNIFLGETFLGETNYLCRNNSFKIHLNYKFFLAWLRINSHKDLSRVLIIMFRSSHLEHSFLQISNSGSDFRPDFNCMSRQTVTSSYTQPKNVIAGGAKQFAKALEIATAPDGLAMTNPHPA